MLFALLLASLVTHLCYLGIMFLVPGILFQGGLLVALLAGWLTPTRVARLSVAFDAYMRQSLLAAAGLFSVAYALAVIVSLAAAP